MARNNIQALVSNPVFLTPQMNIQEGAETTSQILYANKYSGLDEVPMSNELLDIFTDNSLNLTETNFRLQLQHLLEKLDSESGPWYIDGINGIIHIHNRKIAPSSFVYRYQDENGEVLKVNITTNWTTGSSSGTVASNISKNKVRDLSRLDIPTLDFSDPVDVETAARHKPLRYWLPQDNTRVAGTEHVYISTFKDEEGRVTSQTGTTDAWVASQNLNMGADITVDDSNSRAREFEANRKYRETKARHDKMLQGGTDYSKSQEWLQRRVSDPSKAAEEFDQDLLQEMLKSRVKKEKADELLHVIDKIKHQEVLTPAEQRIAQTRIWVDDPEIKAKFGGVSDVRNFEIEGTLTAPKGYGTYGGGAGFSVVGKPGTVVSALTIEELKRNLVQAGVGIKITSYSAAGGSSVYATDIIRTVKKAEESARKNGGMTVGSYSVKVLPGNKYKVTVKVAGDAMNPVFTVMDAGNYLRQRDQPGTGGSKRARALAQINRMRNRAKKAKHKEIEVQMVVIGRPSLKAGMYLDILNIGQKYSGQWYIKTCIHQFDSNGYTCSLTLKRNQTTPNGTAIAATKKRDGSTSGHLYQVNTSQGIIELSADDVAYAHELALKDQNVSFANFIKTAVYAQKKGIYGEGLKRTTNAGEVHMNGTENPDLQFADTDAGKAAQEALAADRKRKSEMAKIAKMKSKAKNRK